MTPRIIGGFTTGSRPASTKRLILTVRLAGLAVPEKSLLAMAAEAHLVVDARRLAMASRCSRSAVSHLVRRAAI